MSSSGPSNNGDSSNSTAGGSSNNTANHQTSATTRQTRSSAQGANIDLQSLPSEDRLSGELLRLARQREIERIISGRVDEAFGPFHIGTNSERDEVYRTLSALTHPDKQPEGEWKEKASKAQQSKS